ncbi:MAG: hypothetical protein MJE68_22990 [Proteobacteria bacterium]|nr:hypothetical protein [Pseudomonadota bacterium]
MAATQTLADLAEKKRKMQLAKVKDIWKARLEIRFDKLQKVTPTAVEVAKAGLKWEPEYTVAGHSTQVRNKLNLIA